MATDSSARGQLPDDASTRDATTEREDSRNFLVMAAYLIVMRIGWIFKTESIIMPAVADLLGAGSWLRGCLPVLSRFGLSIPPLACSRRVSIAPRKRTLLCMTSLMMSATFLTLAFAWRARTSLGSAMPTVFLGLYVLFFMATGVNQLVLGTLSGKLVHADRRGRLMLFANVLGAALAIAMAAWLLPRWLADPRFYFHVFALAGGAFAVTAAISWLLVEPPDSLTQERQSLGRLFVSAAQTLRADKDFRRLAWIAGLFSVSFSLFPHYQAIALGGLGLVHSDMLMWVILQNAGTAVFSLVIGPLADRRGNRLVLRTVLLGVLAAPLLAVSLPHLTHGASLFPLVFLLVGLTPVTVRILHNYVLELSAPADHALYLSTLGLVSGLPVLASPLLGVAIDWVGFLPVFAMSAAMMAVAWSLTWGLVEPRDSRSPCLQPNS